MDFFESWFKQLIYQSISLPSPNLSIYIYVYILLLLDGIVAKFLAYNIVLAQVTQHNYLTYYVYIVKWLTRYVNTYHLTLQIVLWCEL